MMVRMHFLGTANLAWQLLDLAVTQGVTDRRLSPVLIRVGGPPINHDPPNMRPTLRRFGASAIIFAHAVVLPSMLPDPCAHARLTHGSVRIEVGEGFGLTTLLTRLHNTLISKDISERDFIVRHTVLGHVLALALTVLLALLRL